MAHLIQRAESYEGLWNAFFGKKERDEKAHISWKENIEYLASFGLNRESRHLGIAFFSAISILVAMFAILFEASPASWIRMSVHEITFAVSGFFILLLGYQQWHENRHEISMDKYYDRLEIANRTRKEGGTAVYNMMRHSRPEADDVDSRKMEFVYAELDNLEYVAEKYHLGFMKPEQACRGLRTFQKRCFSKEFRELALERVRSGDYNGMTATIVQEVVKSVEAKLADTGDLSLPLPKGSIERRFSLLALWLMY